MSYFKFGSLIQGITSTATAAGTTTLTNTSTQIQNFTGSSTQTVVLPDATGMPVGSSFEVYDSSTGAVTVNKNGGTLITVLTANTLVIVKLSDNSSAAGTWIVQAPAAGGLSIWQTGYSYSVNNVVLYEKNIYTCVTGNTSGSTFEADVALGYWALVNQPQIGRNYMMVGNNFEDNDTGGWNTFVLQTKFTFTVTTLTTAVSYGAVYTNNGNSFTVIQAAGVGATSLVTSANPTPAPTASGNLTFSSGTGQSPTIAYSSVASVTYTAATAPVTFPSNVSVNSMLLDINSSTPISGKYNLRVNNSSGFDFQAGQGFMSQVYGIDRIDQAKILAHKFAYSVSGANANNMNFSGTSANTWAIYILDVTNNAWIQPAGVFNLVQKTGVGISTGTFQTPSNMTQFRLVVLCINNTTVGGVPAVNTLQMDMDDFYLGPQITSIGTIRGPVGSLITTTSITPPTGYLYCDGTAVSRSLYAQLFAAISTTYGVGDGSTTFNLPNSKGVFLRGAGSQTIGAVSYTGTLGTTQGDQLQGHVHDYFAGNTSGGALNRSPFAGGISQNQTLQTTTGPVGNPLTDGTNGTPRTGTETRPANIVVAYHICYDSGNVQVSADTDTRVVSFKAHNLASFTTTAGSVIGINTIDEDTTGSFNVSTFQYQVPVSGDYRFNINGTTGGIGFSAATQSHSSGLRKNVSL